MAQIHPSAVVEEGAQLGEDVSVGPFSYVQNGARIGPGTRLGPRATILEFATLGEGCTVHAGAVVGDLPQDLAFEGEESYVRVGDRTVIRECVTIHRGTNPGSTTTVGDDCMLMACSHIAHNVQLGNRVILANGALLAGHVEVGDQVFMAGNVVVHQFARIGRLAMLSGMSGVNKDIPPFCITRPFTAGVGGLNTVGLRRAKVSSNDRLQLKRTIKILYRAGLNMSQAIERIEQEVEGTLVEEFLAFLRASKRGISPWAGSPSQR